MDYRNILEAQIQIDGFVFSFLMPIGCTYKSAVAACQAIAEGISKTAKDMEEQAKAQAEKPAEAPESTN